jgi:uncharacterized membrane protein AbrB (regulator of aidB expression)
LGFVAVAAGWLIGRARALAVTIVVPVIAVLSRTEQERDGQTPETWVPATLLFTGCFALLVIAGVGLRRISGPERVRRRSRP